MYRNDDLVLEQLDNINRNCGLVLNGVAYTAVSMRVDYYKSERVPHLHSGK